MSASEGVGSQVGVILGPQGQQPAVVAVGGLHVLDLAAPVDSGCELLLPLLHPAHRTVQPHSQRRGHNRFGIGVDLRAEAATDIAGQNPNAILPHTQHPGHSAPLHVRSLGRQPEGHFPRTPLVAGGGRSRLHRVGDQARLHQPYRQYTVGLGKGCIRVAEDAGAGDAEVGAQLFVDYGRPVFHCPFRVHHGWQGFIVNLDKLQGVPRYIGVERDHHGHRFPFVIYLVRGHRPPANDLHVFSHARNGKLGVAKGVELASGHYRQYPRQCLGLADVYITYPGMGVRAAEHHHLGDIPRLNVCGVPPFSLNQPEVLFSPY